MNGQSVRYNESTDSQDRKKKKSRKNKKKWARINE